MGRTIASITQTWHEEEAALRRFERALRKEDQILLDELLVFSRLHLAEASYASNLYPLDMYLIAILLEVYKKLKSLEKEVHGGKEEQTPELVKEERFLEILEDSFRQTLDAQALPAVGLSNELGRVPATVSLHKTEAKSQMVSAEITATEEQENLSVMGSAAHLTTTVENTYRKVSTQPSSWQSSARAANPASQPSFSAAVHNGSSTHALKAHLSQVSTLSYPPCALSDPTVTPSYASFEDAP